MANRYKAERKVTVAKARELRRKKKFASIQLEVRAHALSEDDARIAEIQPTPVRWPRLPDLVAASLLAIAACHVYGHIAWHMLTGQSDSRAHVQFAQLLSEKHSIVAPDFLFQAFVVGVFRSGLVRSFEIAGWVVLLASYALTVLVIYILLHSVLAQRQQVGRTTVLFFITLAAVLLEPLVRPSAYGIGYFWPTTFDNPTSALTKPFSLISFMFTAWFLGKEGARGRWAWVLFALTTAAAVLSKPSFVICLVPATALMGLIRLIGRKPMSLTGLIVGLFAPAAVLLGGAYYVTYSGLAGKIGYHDSIIWAPLVVMRHHTSNLTLKFFLSIAFPLTVLGLYWNRARRDVALMLAWSSFLIASFYAYMLAEKARAFDGNFLWSGYIAVFILFIVTIMFWLREISEQPKSGWLRGRFWACAVMLALHSASGAVVTFNYYKYFG